MVSLDLEAFDNWGNPFLIIKLNLNEFAVSIKQIDAIEEYDKTKIKPKFGFDCLSTHDKIIPILNLKKYLNCPNPALLPTLQSRIIIVSTSKSESHDFNRITVGFYIDALIGLYRGIKLSKEVNKNNYITLELNCYKISSYIEINSKIYPILDLKKLLDSYFLESLLKHFLPEKI